MTRRLTILITALALAALAQAGENHHMANAPSSPAFDRMKSLVGQWKATIPGMGDVTATYSLHSDDSALVEDLTMSDGTTMVSVYYPTAKGVAMTHYCASHNQPHMVAEGSNTQEVAFSEVSVDNLPSKDAMHMKAVDFAFKDAGHFTATWTHAGNGKETPIAFNFARVQ
jgi:hypothetical protein